MSGLYTIFDCLTEGRPFAARHLHEVVHHWAQAAHELASYGTGKDLDRFGLCFLRRGGLEKSIPYGKHGRSAVHNHLDNLQASWINNCDLSPEGQKGADENALDTALEAAFGGDQVEGVAIQVWTFRADQILSSLKNSAWAQKFLCNTSNVNITVVKLAEPRMETPQVPGVKVGKPSSEASFDPLIALKVVTLTTTKSAVSRFLRQRLAIFIPIDLELPGSLEAAVEWKMESFQMDSKPSKTLPCKCVPVVLMVPGQQEAATAQSSISSFQFRRFVELRGIDACCFYGVPLVLRPDAARASAPALSTRLAAREEGISLQTFTEHLAQGVGGLFVSKVCPLELSLKSSTTFTWLATVPLGQKEPMLVLRGLCDLYRAILPDPKVTASLSGAEQMDDVKGSQLGETWPKLSVYNPLRMAPPVQLAATGLRGVEDAWIPSVDAKGRGRGRPRLGKATKGPAAQVTQPAESELRHKSTLEGQTAMKMPKKAPRNSVNTHPERPASVSMDKGPKGLQGGTLAQLAPMLKQPPRRRLRPAGSASELTEEEVRRLAEGNFEFNF
eukprot:symbB.v1.2.027339.t2/scaffold2762.1/size141425/16